MSNLPMRLWRLEVYNANMQRSFEKNLTCVIIDAIACSGHALNIWEKPLALKRATFSKPLMILAQEILP
jgi:hypothetical protein